MAKNPYASDNPFTLEEVVTLSELVKKQRKERPDSMALWDLDIKLFRLEQLFYTKKESVK